MKKVFSILPVIMLLAVGCNSTQKTVINSNTSAPTNQTQDPSNNSIKHYSNASLGLSFDYPATYETHDASPYKRIDLALINGDDVPFGNLNIETKDYQMSVCLKKSLVYLQTILVQVVDY